MKNILKNNYNHTFKHVYAYLLTKQWLHRSALPNRNSRRHFFYHGHGCGCTCVSKTKESNDMLLT